MSRGAVPPKGQPGGVQAGVRHRSSSGASLPGAGPVLLPPCPPDTRASSAPSCLPAPPLLRACRLVPHPTAWPAVPVASCSLNLDWDSDSNPIEVSRCVCGSVGGCARGCLATTATAAARPPRPPPHTHTHPPPPTPTHRNHHLPPRHPPYCRSGSAAPCTSCASLLSCRCRLGSSGPPAWRPCRAWRWRAAATSPPTLQPRCAPCSR